MDKFFHATIFADGSCTHHDTVGAWAAYVVTPTTSKLLCGTAYPSTISRCELMPLIEALQYVARNIVKPYIGANIRLVSDSEYTIQSIGGLYEPHKNDELWEAYRKASEGYYIDAMWRERNSHPCMELVDAAAYTARSKFKEYIKKVELMDLPSVDILEKHKL